MKKKILSADILTPILAYMRVQGDHKVILESIPREKENARFSIVAYNPVFEIKFENGQLTENGKVIESDPLDYLSQITVKSQLSQDLPFNGGAIGFVGYDMVGLYENIGKIPQDTIGTPDMHFFVYESYLIFDHKKEKIVIVEDNIYSGREEEEQKAALQEVLADLKKQAVDEFSERDLHTLTFRNHLEEATFKDMVTKAKKFIRQGD